MFNDNIGDTEQSNFRGAWEWLYTNVRNLGTFKAILDIINLRDCNYSANWETTKALQDALE